MKTAQYLDAVKAKLNVTSDYALRGPLGVTRQAISRYRNEEVCFANDVALRVAAILGIDPVRVIADMEIERAPNAEQRAVWLRVRKAAAVVLAAIGASALVAPSPADAARTQCCNAAEGLHIMLNPRQIWRGCARWARALLALQLAPAWGRA